MDETVAERIVHFVGRQSDARAHGGVDVFPPGAEQLHGFDRRVGHPGKRAAPARVGSAHDDRLVVGEQHWGTIGGEDSEQEVWGVGDQSVGARALVLRPRLARQHDLGGVNLMDRRELGVGQQSGNGEAAVAGDRLAVVVAAIADVEAGHFAHRHAAAPAEETVRELAEADGADDLDAQRVFLMMMSSSA